jgi:hypothetical protein
MIFRLLSFLVLILILTSLTFSQTETSKKHSYIGADACATCHKTDKQGKQFDIWKKSKHSQAFATLQTEKADKIAKEKGFDTPAAKTEACLKCHVSGFNVDASLLEKKFKMEEGVQCETCHGPGSDYKNLKVMKSREESVANGLIVHEKIEDYCISCHNPESPTFVSRNVSEMWEQIKHPVPEKKD